MQENTPGQHVFENTPGWDWLVPPGGKWSMLATLGTEPRIPVVLMAEADKNGVIVVHFAYGESPPKQNMNVVLSL